MLENRSRAKSYMVLAFATFSDLRFVLEFVEPVMVTFGALKVLALELDPPNKIARFLLSRDGTIKFDRIEAQVLHPKSCTTDLTELVRFSDKHVDLLPRDWKIL